MVVVFVAGMFQTSFMDVKGPVNDAWVEVLVDVDEDVGVVSSEELDQVPLANR